MEKRQTQRLRTRSLSMTACSGAAALFSRTMRRDPSNRFFAGTQVAAICLAIILLFSACKTTKKVAAAPKPCEGVICTEIFKSISIKVVDAAGNDVLLSTHSTIRKRDKAVFGRTMNDAANGEQYVLLDDSSVASLANTQDTVTFTATTKDGKPLSADFVVGADCCHIFKVSGPETLVLR